MPTFFGTALNSRKLKRSSSLKRTSARKSAKKKKTSNESASNFGMVYVSKIVAAISNYNKDVKEIARQTGQSVSLKVKNSAHGEKKIENGSFRNANVVKKNDLSMSKNDLNDRKSVLKKRL